VSTPSDGAVLPSPAEPLRVLFRVDASTAIGAGHAMRCLALAQVMRESGHAAWLLSRAMPERIAERYASSGVLRVQPERLLACASEPVPADEGSIGSVDDALDTADAATALKAHWVVADGYGLQLSWQRELRAQLTHTGSSGARGTRLAVLDDEARAEEWAADLLLNQNLGVTPARYGGRSGNAVVLAGAPYALLRAELRRHLPVQRQQVPQATKVLVTMGGSDPENITTRCIEAMGMLERRPLALRIVVGDANPHGEQIAAALRALPSWVESHMITGVADMAPHFLWADLAVSAGGSTLWELAAFGVPALVLVLAENQQGGVQACEVAGTVESLGASDRLTPAGMAARVNALLDDEARRRRMAEAGVQLVDGQGARRVLQVMTHLTAGRAA